MYGFEDLSTYSRQKTDEFRSAELDLFEIEKRIDERMGVSGHLYGWIFNRNDTCWVAENLTKGLTDEEFSELISVDENGVFTLFSALKKENGYDCIAIYSIIGMNAFLRIACPHEKLFIVPFEQLSKGVQADVLRTFRDDESFDDFYGECIVTENTIELAKTFNSPVIYYSGFCSQGDGASFTCEKTKITKELLEEAGIKIRFKSVSDLICSEAYFEIKRNGSRYNHERSVTTNVECQHTGRTKVDSYIENVLNEFDSYLTDKAEKLSRKIYKELEEAFWDFQSEESVLEEIKCNDYKFLTTGKLWQV